MNEKQQQLTFDKGITSVPSDALCSDNALEDCTDLIFRDGEHHVLQKPKLIANNAPTIVFVHAFNNAKRYIGIDSTGIVWGTIASLVFTKAETPLLSGTFSKDDVQVAAIGKTLIVCHEGTIYYYLWKGDTYLNLGSSIPEPNVHFYLDTVESFPEGTFSRTIINISDWVSVSSSSIDSREDGTEKAVKITPSDETEKHNALQNALIGEASSYIKKVNDNGAFVLPFVLRYALVLYDDTVTKLSAPILCFPSVRRSLYFVTCNRFGATSSWTGLTSTATDRCVKVDGAASWLRAQLVNSTDFANWHDIIKGIRVYASEGIKPFSMEDRWMVDDFASGRPVLKDRVNHVAIETMIGFINKSIYRETVAEPIEVIDGANYFPRYFFPVFKSDPTIMKELGETSVFYQFFDFRIDRTEVVNAEQEIGRHAVTNLAQQTQLPADDYFSHTQTNARRIFTYNNRLNIADISRKAFEGFHQFTTQETIYGYTFKIAVYITTDSGELVVLHDCNNTAYRIDKYFYYPDPRAKKAEIYAPNGSGGWNRLYAYTLTEHPALHGAYSFSSLPSNEDSTTDGVTWDDHYPTGTVGNYPAVKDIELLPNIVQSSEVNNPLSFPAKGTFNVGEGHILALSTITHALSEGQFGSFPLVIFATDGLWAASFDAEGFFTKTDPLPREIYNEDSVVLQTDDNIIFPTDKGLMAMAGRDVNCVSSMLGGRAIVPFVTYLRGSAMAYDYRDSLIWISNPAFSYSFVLNLKNGVFSKSTVVFSSAVNDYPDSLLQNGQNLYSLIGRVNANLDEDTYQASFTTRPMKLENALALKSIMQIRHIYQFSDGASLTVKVYASNNLNTWVQLYSLRGIPWKYYKFKYDFTNLRAVDTFSGSLLVTQERRTDKLR